LPIFPHIVKEITAGLEEMRLPLKTFPSFQLLGLEPDKVLEICDEIRTTVKDSAGAFKKKALIMAGC